VQHLEPEGGAPDEHVGSSHEPLTCGDYR
jgi:hypothetical protein